MFLETSRGKYVGFILTLGVTDLLRSLEVIKGHQRSNLKNNRTQTCYMFLETSRGKYVGFILALGVTDLLRSIEVIGGH